MRTTIVACVATALLSATGCKKEEPKAPDKPPPAAPEAKAPAQAPEKAPEKPPEKAPEVKAPEKPPEKAPEKPPTPAPPADPLAAKAATLPPTVPTPAPQTVGSVTLRADFCAHDGRPFYTEVSTDYPAGPVAAAPDGSLYVLDHEQAVRHYRVMSGATCQLELDTAFGEAGYLRLEPGKKWMSSALGLAVDEKGRLLVSRWGLDGFS